MSEPSRTHETNCPRCGYDQRGVIESWRDFCPLQGRCPECGLDFAWVKVMRPELHEPRWCVEYALTARDIPKAAAVTFGLSFLPWRFWSRLQMSHAIRRRRLVVYLLFLLLLIGGSYVFEQATVAIRNRVQLNQRMEQAIADAPSIIKQYQNWMKRVRNDPDSQMMKGAQGRAQQLIKSQQKLIRNG